MVLPTAKGLEKRLEFIEKRLDARIYRIEETLLSIQGAMKSLQKAKGINTSAAQPEAAAVPQPEVRNVPERSYITPDLKPLKKETESAAGISFGNASDSRKSSEIKMVPAQLSGLLGAPSSRPQVGQRTFDRKQSAAPMPSAKSPAIPQAPESALGMSTPIDSLYRIAKQSGKIKLAEAATALGAPEETIEEWARVLESQGLVKLKYRPFGKPEMVVDNGNN